VVTIRARQISDLGKGFGKRLRQFRSGQPQFGILCYQLFAKLSRCGKKASVVRGNSVISSDSERSPMREVHQVVHACFRLAQKVLSLSAAEFTQTLVGRQDVAEIHEQKGLAFPFRVPREQRSSIACVITGNELLGENVGIDYDHSFQLDQSRPAAMADSMSSIVMSTRLLSLTGFDILSGASVFGTLASPISSSCVTASLSF
jgi:hypothetical protein